MIALLLIILPIIFAFGIWIFNENKSAVIALLGTIATLVVGIYAFVIFQQNIHSLDFVYRTNWIRNFGAYFYIKMDAINSILVLLTVLLLPFIVYSAFNKNIKNTKAYFSLMLLMQSALLGVFMAKDALLFYVFWEMALIPIYLICLVYGAEGRQRITFKFFIYTLTGSLFMLLAILFLWLQNAGESFSIYDFYKAGATMSPYHQVAVFIAFYLAFAIKIPIFPLHSWQTDTYVNAPTQGTMLLSGIMLKMGTFALIVWLIPIVPIGWQIASKYVIIISVISVLYGLFLAIAQYNFKRMLAYSSLGHVGLIAAGIFCWNLQGVQGALFQMLSHGITVVALFYVCDIVIEKTGTDEMPKLGGIRQSSKVFSVLFLIALLGSVALPFTNGFVGEFLLLHSVFQYSYVLAALAALTVIFSALYMLRAYQQMMHGETNELTENFGGITLQQKIILSGFAILIFFFGLFPNVILHISEDAVKHLIEQVRVATTVVDTHAKF